MDVFSLDLTIFLVATFAGALVAGLSGFAFGLVAASIWLYILTPLQTATLIVAFGLIVQGYSVWKLRHALEWAKLWPFMLGAAVGVPIGVAILGWANPAHVRESIGVFLVLYSLYALFRPKMASITGGGRAAGAGVGFLKRPTRRNNGTCGYIGDDLVRPAQLAERSAASDFSAGCGCDLRHERRVAGHQGSVSADTIRLFLFGLPVLLAGTWLGVELYGHLDETAFRRVVLVLLSVSGAVLIF
jgi:uncharacterized membrane protein YfcA